MIRKASAVLAVAGVVVGVVGLLHPAPVDATSHSAARSFSAPSVLPGGTLEVTIAATGYGGFGLVIETLPDGFGYAGSNLSEAAVSVEGQTISFTLLGDASLTYTVAAPGAEGSYSFSGVLLDANRVEGTGRRRSHHQGRARSHPNARCLPQRLPPPQCPRQRPSLHRRPR